jgi:hypothetical protein
MTVRNTSLLRTWSAGVTGLLSRFQYVMLTLRCFAASVLAGEFFTAPVVDPRTQTGPNLGLFSNPAFGTGGNLMRNKFFGPGINNWDIVLQKNTRISERMIVEFRAEVYNLFNRVQFNQPGNLTSDPGTFGQSTGEVTRPDGTSEARQVQFGLRFQF